MTGLPLAAIRQQCRQGLSPALLEHTLAIVEFFIAVRQAVAQESETDKNKNHNIENHTIEIEHNIENHTIENHTIEIEHNIEIERWLPELLCRHEYDIRRLSQGAISQGSKLSQGSKAGESWQREIFKPDGFLRLRQCGSSLSRHECQNRSYFLEIDRGHVSSEKFLGKLRSHRRYLESGLFAEVYGEGEFRTLVVTTSQKRLENLRRLVQDAGEDLFWLTTFEEIVSDGLLASIWQVPGQFERTALI